MNIQERINTIKPHFIEMNVSDGIIYVAVTFPEKWAINELINENYDVNVAPIQSGGFYFYTNLVNGFDRVFDAIDYTIKFNEQAEEKIKLLIAKVDELKEIFNEEDIEILKTIEFKFKKKRIKKVINKEIKPPIDNIDKPVNEENNSVDDNIKNEETIEDTNTIENIKKK